MEINLLITVLLLGFAHYAWQRQRLRMHRLASGKLNKGKQRLTKFHTRPRYYGYCAFLWTVFPALLLALLLQVPVNAGELTSGWIWPITIGTALIGTALGIKLLTPKFKARDHVDGWINIIFIISAITAICITIMIVASVMFESLKFFEQVPLTEFLFGTHWSPQTALRADQSGSSGAFGAVPVFLGTLLITFIAMCVATPLGLLSAVYLSEYASPRFRNIAKPLLEVLAGVPTVVYGYFAVVTFAPFLRDLGQSLSLDIAAESALAAGMVMGMMIIPFVLSLSDDVIRAVPQRMRDASTGLGATRSETIRQVLIPAALPGIMGAVLLGVSRGVGETMIVTMAAGLAATLTINPLDSVTTVTAQIVTLLVGDQEFDSTKTLAAFSLSLWLFVATLILNSIAMFIVRKYREQYD